MEETIGSLWVANYLGNLSKTPETGRFNCVSPPLTQTKKEAHVSTSIIVSAEGLAIFVKDLQEMATQTIYKRDDRGNRILDDNGDYVIIDVPVHDRWVNFGDIKVNAEGKFVLKVSDSTLNSMEAHNARKARVDTYQAA
jgi:hypothetical protein